ncbi:MAG: hypothetical protein RLZZ283_640 [Candidatus Parcubacteria bacterium]|jgi:hypothetical protein
MGLLLGSGGKERPSTDLGIETFSPKGRGPDRTCKCEGTGWMWQDTFTPSFNGQKQYKKSVQTPCKNPAHKMAGFR